MCHRIGSCHLLHHQNTYSIAKAPCSPVDKTPPRTEALHRRCTLCATSPPASGISLATAPQPLPRRLHHLARRRADPTPRRTRHHQAGHNAPRTRLGTGRTAPPRCCSGRKIRHHFLAGGVNRSGIVWGAGRFLVTNARGGCLVHSLWL